MKSQKSVWIEKPAVIGPFAMMSSMTAPQTPAVRILREIDAYVAARHLVLAVPSAHAAWHSPVTPVDATQGMHASVATPTATTC